MLLWRASDLLKRLPEPNISSESFCLQDAYLSQYELVVSTLGWQYVFHLVRKLGLGSEACFCPCECLKKPVIPNYSTLQKAQ